MAREKTNLLDFLYEDTPTFFSPTLAKEIGLNEAIVLQQLHYWLKTSHHLIGDEAWVYNSYKQWQERFPFWSVRTIKRTLASLEEQNLVKTGNFNKLKFDRTKWYTINYDELGARKLGSRNDGVKLTKSN